jgi:hypothetical protein
MPSPSGNPGSKSVPVERQIVVHALTDMDGVDRTEGPLYDRIRTEQVAVLQADSEGRFTGCLPPGEYSVFTVEEGGFFANRFDGGGHIQPVTIRAGDTTDIVIDINYRAYY